MDDGRRNRTHGARLRTPLRVGPGKRPERGTRRPNTPLAARVVRRLAGGLLVAFLASAAAADPWTRQDAVDALARVDLGPTVAHLTALTTPENPAALLDALDATAVRPDWPAPVRDAAIHGYAVALHHLPARTVPDAALRWLAAYPPQALVPHEDHPGGLVPLFNIRAATDGAVHAWLRREARSEASALLEARPRALVDAFLLEPHPAVRAGYLEALTQASPQVIGQVGALAGGRLPEQPSLTPLAAHAAALRRDATAMAAVLERGSGPGLRGALTDFARTGDPALVLEVLGRALATDNAATAHLALAELYPAVAGHPTAERILVAHLGDERLGTAVALALAKSPSPDTSAHLEDRARDADDTASRNARLALQLRAERNREALP